MDDDMDTSWIDAEEVIEKESMEKVMCFFVYIDNENQIKDIQKELCTLEVDTIQNSDSTKIPRNRLLGIIQKKKIFNGEKYRLMDILHFNVPYDFTNLVESSYQNMLKVVTTDDEIRFEPSLCIFHEINSIYFLFQELPKYWNDTDVPAKPALKIYDTTSIPKKKTKRVSFKDLDLRHTKKYKK